MKKLTFVYSIFGRSKAFFAFTVLIVICMFCADILQAQPIQKLMYDYSPTGNRRKCYVGYMKIVSPSASEEQEQYSDTIDNIQFSIYPNPTKGIMKINIETDIRIEDIRLELYDIYGKKLIDRNFVSKDVEIDITGAVSGHYFMKIFINNKPHYWNVLKE